MYILYIIYFFAQATAPQATAPHRHSAMASQQMRAKQTISNDELKEIMKRTMPAAGNEFLWVDQKALLQQHNPFFIAVSAKTARLNSVAVGAIGKDLFGFTKPQSVAFGTQICQALAYAKKAGEKATTGAKLGPDINSISANISRSSSMKSDDVKEEVDEAVKAEPKVNAEPQAAKRKLQVCISSPSHISRLYGHMRVVKQEPQEVAVVKKEKKDVKKEVVVCIYIYIYIYHLL